LKGYLGIETGLPDYKALKPKIRVKVSSELANDNSYRPYMVCAVVRNFKFDHDSVKEIMTLQENLHWAVGRDRVKCSIGVYDLDKLVPDFEYKATKPEENSFVPLGNPLNRAMSPQEILESHPKGVKYAHIINKYDKYPLLVDKNNKVLSMPPIINNEDPKITLDSKNIFIDVTGTDKKVITRTLNILVASIVEYGGELEQVEVVYENETDITPDVTPFETKIEPAYTNKLLGFELNENEIADLLKKMRYDVTGKKGNSILLKVPFFRSDILHQVDLIEDVAIAYGYHNIKPSLVKTFTLGKDLETEEETHLIRNIMLGHGFFETKTLMLTSPEVHYEKMNFTVPDELIEVSNPASVEQRILRGHLVSGLMETFQINKHNTTPQEIFEIGDIAVLDKDAETGTVYFRKIAGGILDPKADFTSIRAICENLLNERKISFRLADYRSPMFLEGRAAEIIEEKSGKHLGFFGEIHPVVLENFGLIIPVSVFEIII
jgi:phenylalanyl-tRNA synthetase beta chain